MTRLANLTSKTLTVLRANPRVADIENEGCDDERFFVHLTPEWSYTWDPCAVTHSRSFSNAREAVKAVREAVRADEWLPKSGAFNTRRLYTAHGQRIAWQVLSTGNVAMYDLDRMIDYVLKIDGTPTNASVQRAYDTHGRDQNNTAPYNEAEYREARDLQSALIQAARDVPVVQS